MSTITPPDEKLVEAPLDDKGPKVTTINVSNLLDKIESFEGDVDFVRSAVERLRQEYAEEEKVQETLMRIGSEHADEIIGKVQEFVEKYGGSVQEMDAELDRLAQELKDIVTSNLGLIAENQELLTKIQDADRNNTIRVAMGLRAKAAELIRDVKERGRWGDTEDEVFNFKCMRDGSSAPNAAESGFALKRTHPELPSGMYWIKSHTMPKALEMYVDMKCGYDYYAIKNGKEVTCISDEHSGAALGLSLVSPRSQKHWLSMKEYATKLGGERWSSWLRAIAVYRTQTSNGGNYTRYCMNSASNVPDWRVEDGGQWHLRSTPYGEPNGDYTHGGLLGLRSMNDEGDVIFNDLTAGFSTGTTYLVSTNMCPN